MPATVHPAPRDVAVVGLGSGDTAWASACRPETRSRHASSRSRPPQPRILLRQARGASRTCPTLRRPARRTRGCVRVEDGRQALEREDRLRPHRGRRVYLTSAGSGNLYSLEFFSAARGSLKPGGLVCSQKPNRRVALTFAEALPHVVDFGNMVVGSNQEIPLDTEAWLARLRSAPVARRFDKDTLAGIEERLVSAAPGDRNPTARIGINRDLFPRDEFGTPVGW